MNTLTIQRNTGGKILATEYSPLALFVNAQTLSCGHLSTRKCLSAVANTCREAKSWLFWMYVNVDRSRCDNFIYILSHSLLYKALSYNNEKLLDYCLDAGARADLYTFERLFEFSNRNALRYIERVLENGIDFDINKKLTRHIANYDQYEEMEDEDDIEYETFLYKAIDIGYEPLVKSMIDAGADVNAKYERHWAYYNRVDYETPLHSAIRKSPHTTPIAIVQMLIDAGADVNAKDSEGKTPLMILIEMDMHMQFMGKPELPLRIAEMLFKAGAVKE
jgi:hypothetical protein